MKKIYFDTYTKKYIDGRDYDANAIDRYITIVDIAPLGSTFEIWKSGERHFAFGYTDLELKNGDVKSKRITFAFNSNHFPIEHATLYEVHKSKSKFDEICKAYELTPIII